MSSSTNLHSLVLTVAAEAGLSEQQSSTAVACTLRYLTARLPSPAVGQLHELLQGEPISRSINPSVQHSEE